MAARRFVQFGILCCAVAAVRADTIVSIDKLDSTDGFPMPDPGIVVVDVHVDVAPNDRFVGIGFRAIALNGATFVYAHDPNGDPILSAPGVENRFATFASRPRGRDADARFRVGAGLNPAGGFCIPLPFPVIEDAVVDAALFGGDATEGGDGWVCRFAVDLSGVANEAFRTDSAAIVVAQAQPPNSVRLFETRCEDIAGALQIGTNLTTVDSGFGIYGIVPEPANAMLLVALLLLRSRRS